MSRSARLPLVLLLGAIAMLVWSGVMPHDRFTWVLEVFPVLIAVLGSLRRAGGLVGRDRGEYPL